MQIKNTDADRSKFGYTTGSYAAAAAKAATLLLLTGKNCEAIKITLPSGSQTGTIKVCASMLDGKAICRTEKESPETMDATNRLNIVASAKKIVARKIEIKAGIGIGTATRPGLQVLPGKPAINPVPVSIIKGEVEKVIRESNYDGGIEITLSVPGGKEAAKQTFNGRLGIKGGISILGTTGILKPMSYESLKVSLLQQIDVAVAEGHKRLVIVPGNLGESGARRRLKDKNMPVIQANNLFGDMLLHCKERGVESVLLLGHIGKLAKLGAGQMNTHSRFSDAARKALCMALETTGGPGDDRLLKEGLPNFSTVEEAARHISAKRPEAMDELAKMCSFKAQQFIDGNIEIGITLTLLDGSIIAKYVSDRKWERDICFM